MNLAIAWVLFPLVLGGLCGGCGLVVERLTATRTPGRPGARGRVRDDHRRGAGPDPLGLRRRSSSPRSWSRWRIVGLRAVVGLVAAPSSPGPSRSSSACSRLYAAPDRPLRAGHLRRLHPARRHRDVDGAHRPGHGARTQPRPGWRRRPTRRPSPSTSASGTRSASSCRWASRATLVGQDVAWVIQPYMAFVRGCSPPGAMAARGPRGPLRAPRRRCRVPRRAVGPPGRLLPVGRHQGGRRARPSSRAAAGLAGVGDPGALRASGALIPLAVVGAALIGVLSGGGGIWLAGVLVAALLAGGAGDRRAQRRCSRPPALIALTRPPVRAGPRAGRVPAAHLGVAHSATALGNLLHPLNELQLFGIWPAGDFRLDAVDPGAAYALIAVAGVAALVGLGVAWRRRAWSMLIYVGGGARGLRGDRPDRLAMDRRQGDGDRLPRHPPDGRRRGRCALGRAWR